MACVLCGSNVSCSITSSLWGLSVCSIAGHCGWGNRLLGEPLGSYENFRLLSICPFTSDWPEQVTWPSLSWTGQRCIIFLTASSQVSLPLVKMRSFPECKSSMLPLYENLRSFSLSNVPFRNYTAPPMCKVNLVYSRIMVVAKTATSLSLWGL